MKSKIWAFNSNAFNDTKCTVKLGNEMLGTGKGKIYSFIAGFVIAGLISILNCNLGSKKLALYILVFFITECSL